jgi:hypothetical protein
LEVRVEAECDARGCLLVERSVAVGFQRMRCGIKLQDQGSLGEEAIRTLIAAAEHSSVIMQIAAQWLTVQTEIENRRCRSGDGCCCKPRRTWFDANPMIRRDCHAGNHSSSSPLSRSRCRQRQTAGGWSAGDYAVVGTTLQMSEEETLCEAVDCMPASGFSMLLPAMATRRSPRLGAGRSHVDHYVPALSSGGRIRASADERLRELFAARFRLDHDRVQGFVFRYRSTTHWLEVFRTAYGPMEKAFGALDRTKQESLAADLIALAERFNRATDGSLVAPSQYAGVVIRRR